MDYMEEIKIYLKTGAIFAKCYGSFCQEEDDEICKYIQSIKENKRFDTSNVEDIIKENYDKIRCPIMQMTKEEIKSKLFTELVPETKEYLKSLRNDDEKQEVVKDLDKFIKKIIKSDKKIAKDEKELLNNWRNEIYPYVGIKVPKKIKILEIIPYIVLIAAIVITVIIGIINNMNKKSALEAFPLSSYTEKMLQFKEIDFSKVLIYGTETSEADRDSLFLYFAKGTAVLRFSGLDNLSVDTNLTTEDTLFLNYNMENQTVLPIDVEIIYDESKCRFIDSFEATTLKDSPVGKGIKGITTVAGTAGGVLAGQAIGGLFGIQGQLIGAASGAVIGGVGSYIASANFVKKTKLVQDNSSSTIRDMLEDAKPVIAAQLLSDETITQNTDENEPDIQKISNYYRQELADILTNIICSDENNKWKNVEIRFVGAGFPA